MIGVEQGKRLVNLDAFFIRPWLIWELRARLHRGPSTQSTRTEHEPPPATRTTNDSAATRIK